MTYNPVQGLYRLSKKRAACEVLNDNKPSFSGSVNDAKPFFTKVFREKTSNIDEMKPGLEENVPSAPDNDLGVPLTSDEVAKELRFASNSSPGADKFN